jgi:hypothetical protein
MDFVPQVSGERQPSLEHLTGMGGAFIPTMGGTTFGQQQPPFNSAFKQSAVPTAPAAGGHHSQPDYPEISHLEPGSHGVSAPHIHADAFQVCASAHLCPRRRRPLLLPPRKKA